MAPAGSALPARRPRAAAGAGVALSWSPQCTLRSPARGLPLRSAKCAFFSSPRFEHVTHSTLYRDAGCSEELVVLILRACGRLPLSR
ncbi:hypothetical protein V5799_005889 [Amblyomma americanum]|uniref:Uncharacterized protein n=1 Tax=Amblyomma americanum TaxID=6943 RepID=A0AAQ4DXZ1_AMBAM